jgi:hypothetical protein
MDIAYNMNHIGRLYKQQRPHGNAVAPKSEPQQSPTAMPEDHVTFSQEALAQNGQKHSNSNILAKDRDISPEEKQVVNDLKRRDTEVKAHEAAHMAAGSGIVQGGASYEYQSGPDGKMYAVGGEVQIDVSAESSPEATIQKMQQVRAAALAPAQPSGTDRAVAAQASQIEAQARIEKMKENKEYQRDQEDDPLRTSPSDLQQYAASKSPLGSRIDFMA